MSSTNKTTNYELSQFVGSDKPAWLADYNTDMGKIDAGMKANADANTVTDGKADTNATNIGTLANLNTTAKTDIVSAVNEVYTTAGTASSTATQAGTNANSAKAEADALTRYLSITQTGSISPSVSGGTIGNINDLYYALNADGTLGKIYGRFRFTVSTTGTVTVTLPVAPLTTESQFTIAGACWWSEFNANASIPWEIFNARDMVVNTNGNCTVTFSNLPVGASVTMWFPPCLYFFTDFGDVVDPNN